MDQKIFDAGLSVETTSAYLLCRGLEEAGVTLSEKNLLEKWNGAADAFYQSMKELEEKNIIRETDAEKDGGAVYVLSDAADWEV